MSFRQRQKLRLAPSIEVFDVERETLENGAVVSSSVSQSKKEMPDAALFDLNNQLKSGVNLEEVNSKVLSPSSVDFDAVSKKLSNNQPKKEDK